MTEYKDWRPISIQQPRPDTYGELQEKVAILARKNANRKKALRALGKAYDAQVHALKNALQAKALLREAYDYAQAQLARYAAAGPRVMDAQAQGYIALMGGLAIGFVLGIIIGRFGF